MNLSQVISIVYHFEVFILNFKLLQKLGSLLSSSRRSLINSNAARHFSAEIQRGNENQTAPIPVEVNHNDTQLASTSAEKDKLFSRLEIELKGIEPEVMKSYAWFAVKAAEHLGINVGKW